MKRKRKKKKRFYKVHNELPICVLMAALGFAIGRKFPELTITPIYEDKKE